MSISLIVLSLQLHMWGFNTLCMLNFIILLQVQAEQAHQTMFKQQAPNLNNINIPTMSWPDYHLHWLSQNIGLHHEIKRYALVLHLSWSQTPSPNQFTRLLHTTVQKCTIVQLTTQYTTALWWPPAVGEHVVF